MVFTQSQIRDIQSVVEKAVKTIATDKDFLSAIPTDNKLKATIEELNTKIESYKQRIDAIELQNEELVRDNKALNCEMDNLRQYSRRNNLRIFGLESAGDTDSTLIKFFNEKLGLDVNKTDIDRSHMIGRSTKHLIVKFTTYNARRLILLNRKKLKGTKVVITENLTKYRLTLFKLAKEIMGKRNVWTRDGTVWVQCGNRKCPVRDELELAQMEGCRGVAS